MPELRLILLAVGLVFLAGLALWEARRGHQVRGSDLPRPVPDPPERLPERSNDWDSPTLDLPRMSARDPEAQLPVVEVQPDDFARLEARAQIIEVPVSFAELPVEEAVVAAAPEDFREEVATVAADYEPDVHVHLHEPEPEPEPEEAQSATVAMAPSLEGMEHLLSELGASQRPDPPISDITESFRSNLLGEEPFEVESVTVRTIEMPRPAPASASHDDPQPEAVPATPAAWTAPVMEPEPVVVDWPASTANQILAVRLVSGGEKFSGRAVRLALAAEGFSLGKFSIFHKPAADGRALLSIASLNKPGTFEAHSIDMQRYSGLNLFTVLPGPVPGPDAVDEMLMCAQVLSQRLRGNLQDEQGAPLTPSRTATMRNAAAAATR